jgi:hypothetical protein
MSAGHTPGPWDIVPLTAPKGSYMIAVKTVGREPLVCCVEHSKNGPINHDQAGENARLIAAAPELLDALELLLAGEGEYLTLLGIRSKARAAIAKATGATP